MQTVESWVIDWFEAVLCAGMAWCRKEALSSGVRACQSRLWAARVSQPQLGLPPPSSGGHTAAVVALGLALHLTLLEGCRSPAVWSAGGSFKGRALP